jgi:hypothetical protein
MSRDEGGGSIVAGAILIVVGLIFLGGRIDLPFGWSLGRLWPVILLTLGAIALIRPGEQGSRGSGVWLLFVGGIFLLNNYGVVSIRDSWPLFIVAGGVSIVAKALRPARRQAPPSPEVRHDR